MNSELKETLIAFSIMLVIMVAIARLVYLEDKQIIENNANQLKEQVDTIIEFQNKVSFFNKTPEEGLMDALLYFDIQHPDIVYSQAILESGLGKSSVYKKTNNLFGLYNSKGKCYFQYDHWVYSVIGYKNMIQSRYRNNENYYQFLLRIGYAEDPNYINKLKIINKN